MSPHADLERSRSGGIYPIRDLHHNARSFDKRSADVAGGSQTLEVQERDIRRKQEFSGWVLLAYQSVGVIYGDIGTSPLYVYSSTFSSNPSYDDLLGALSLIIWTLTLMVSVKYVFIVLRADDEGEGGTFALYSLLSRYANIIERDPKEMAMIKMERCLSSEIRRSGRTLRSGIEQSRIAKTALKVIGVLGVSLVMSDGVLTPAQSVLGAIQGLSVVKPDITSGTVIGVTCAILVLLFLIQPLGTSKIAHTFAPVVIIWLLFNFAFGIYNLAQHDHSVLKAFSPYFAGNYLVRNKTDGWKNLGGILLAFTGVEAMFADLGAFSRRAVQLSWMCFAFPCLLLAYIGQAAYISDVPTAYANPFFLSAPPGMFYPSLVISILAAIVASQAMITSTFQLLSQIMKLSYFPQIKLVHTSKIFHGQVYIPFANWLLMVGTIIVTAVYSNTTRLGHAYGVCVIFVTFITTCMVSIVALLVWQLNPFLVLIGFLVFGSLDGAYLSSALTKVPSGAWFTLLLAVILSSVFILWRFGKEQQWKAEAEDRFQPTHLVKKGENGQLRLTSVFGGDTLTDIKGLGIFFDKVGDMTPLVFIQFLHKFTATPQVMVFFHLRPLSRPSVPPEERYTITRTGISNCYRLIIRHGYMDEVITKDLGMLIYEQLRDFTIHEDATGARSSLITNDKHVDSSTSPLSSTASSSPKSIPSAAITEAQSVIATRLAALQTAYQAQVVYIVGKEQMRIRKGTNIGRRVALGAYLWLRENTRGKMAAMGIPTDKLVEVGFIKEV
ncbi:K potassium transporter [Lasallia pustulata]|uniref:K potassium transporter n=1 Tax=Lasallia pustulata TaxID=136370 RepID=A0A1W5CX22_9LECA|nr:K potassium transporter [Lasallia pustulata]